MNNLRVCPLFFFLSLFLLVLSCQQNDSKTSKEVDPGQLRGEFIPEADLAELIIDLNSGMEEAYNKGDMKAVAAFYSDQALLLGPNGYKVEGIESVNEYWTRINDPINWKLSVIAFSRREADLYQTDAYKSMGNKPPDWKTFIGDRLNGKDVVYQLGHSTLMYKKEGKVHTSDVDFIIVWVQQADGTYKIGVDTYARN